MIEVEQLSKVYGTTHAIQDVTFEVAKGEILGFLGPNGAGKTTTMRILAGFLPATSGTARIAGYDVHEDSMAVRQRIGYLPENPPLYTDMSVEGFLHFVARIKGIAAGDRSEKVNRAIERCGLVERRKTLIRKLSKGFRQRVGIAQAIVHEPPAIILDEPTVGLDPRQIIDVRNLIKSLAGERTIILSTHILPEVNMTCSQVAIIKRGQIVATDAIENLMTRLMQGVAYEVEIQGDVDGLEKAMRAFLGNLPDVKTVVAVSDDRIREHRYRFRIEAEAGREPGQRIAAAIVDAKLGLCEMRRIQASLEEVFLELTTEETIHEEATDRGESAEEIPNEAESTEDVQSGLE